MLFCCCRRAARPLAETPGLPACPLARARLARWRAIVSALLYRKLQNRLFALGFVYLKDVKKAVALRGYTTAHDRFLKQRLHELGVWLNEAKKCGKKTV